MRILLLSILSIVTSSYTQKPNFEQAAFDFFIEKVYKQNYKDSPLAFDGRVKNERTYFFSYIGMCLEEKSDAGFREKLGRAAEAPILNSDLNLTLPEGVKFRRKAATSLEVYQSSGVDGLHYVVIILKTKTFQKYFYYELDDDVNVTQSCEKGVIF